MAGAVDAVNRLAPRVAQHSGPHIQHHVTLTDGAQARQRQLVTHVPPYPLILDIIPATEYLWGDYIWHVVSRLGQAPLKVPVATSSKIAWSNWECIGR
jgi:hypothetical protein